jgi:hypothetical protein
MNEGTGTYTRALRNRASAYRRFYEPGDCLDTQPTRRILTALLLMLVCSLGVTAFAYL